MQTQFSNSAVKLNTPTQLDERGMVRVMPTHPLSYQPDRWNTPALITNVNCFGYGLNDPRVGSPFLGSLKYSREEYKTTKKNLKDLFDQHFKVHGFAATAKLRIDFVGLKRIRKHELNPLTNHILGFSTYCGHFLRLDNTGVWSHKPGEDPVRNTDDFGDALLDLDTANWEEYERDEDEIIYMTIPEEGIDVDPLFDL